MEKKTGGKSIGLGHLLQTIILLVAVLSLFYTAWRVERSEYNSTIRAAGFEALQKLGQLQLMVDYAHYDGDREKGNPITGWAYVLYLRDLGAFFSEGAVQVEIQYLFGQWEAKWSGLNDRVVVETITEQIKRARQAVLLELKHLH